MPNDILGEEVAGSRLGPDAMKADIPTIHVISDSVGDTAAEVALAAAAQFDAGSVRVERLPQVTNMGQVREYLDLHQGAAGEGRLAVFHTIADESLRKDIVGELAARSIPETDILGPALNAIAELTGKRPLGQAGTIRKTDAHYFRRIDAMEFFVEHDDGRNPQDLTKADIVLVGVSRTSKTPLSMYLSFQGYFVANVPLARGMTPPKELFDVEPFRVFGLLSTPEVLSTIRCERLASPEERAVASSYVDPDSIQDELDDARALMRRLGCMVMHTDGRAIEETARLILKYYDPAEARYEKERTLSRE